MDLATFTHSICTWANSIKFAYQSLCDPPIFMLLKAMRKGHLKGCLNISKKLILKYLNPSPVTAKGYIKHPCHGIKSTTPKTIVPPQVECKLSLPNIPLVPVMPILLPIIDLPCIDEAQCAWAPNVILDDSDEFIANVFCFGAFTDKHFGVVYNNLTSKFPFISYNGSVCFIVVNHYKANAILATPIAGLDDVWILEAYKKTFIKLPEKGFKPKLNIMDNQTPT